METLVVVCNNKNLDPTIFFIELHTRGAMASLL